MKNVRFFAVCFILLFAIFISQLRLINRPVRDNDEGIYLTTFLLINKGHPAYKETYLSQPPGFIISTYPGFLLFGKNLPAARLTIGLWSIVSLLAIVWIGFELRNKWLGPITIFFLYLIPYYTNQTLTFQSDILIGAFSLISFASIFRYRNNFHLRWLILSTIFLNLAFWTKFDITLLPSIAALLFFTEKERVKSFGVFLIVSIIFFILFILPFGMDYIYRDAISLRFKALANSSSSFFY